MRRRSCVLGFGLLLGSGIVSPAWGQSTVPPRPRATSPSPTRPTSPKPAAVPPASGSSYGAPSSSSRPKSPSGSAAPAPARGSEAGARVAPRPVPPVAPAVASGFYPPRLPTYRNLPPPPGYVLEVKRSWGMILGGGGILAGAYIAGLAVAGGDPSDNSGAMAIPVVGPWIALGSRSFRCELDLTLESAERCQEETNRETTIVASYAAVGVAQLLGVSLLVIGILDRHESWVRQDLSLHVPSTEVSLKPVFGLTGGGLSVGVRF